MPKRTIYFPELFNMIGEVKTKKEKIALLHKYQGIKGFYDILKLCYDPRIVWIVTRKEIENLTYDHMDIAYYDLAPSTLFLEARRRLYNYTNVRQPPLKKYKVLQLIAGMFSALHHDEIELFKQMVDGRIDEKGMTTKLIRDAFPNLLSPEVVKKDPEPTPEPEPTHEPVPEPVENKPAPVKKRAGRPKGSVNKKKAGRPKGAKNKNKVTSDDV